MQNIGVACGGMVRAEGVRLFDLSCLSEALAPLLTCSFCSTGTLELKEDLDKADKLYSSLYLVCETCPHRLQIHTSPPLTEHSTSCRWEVNRCSEKLLADLSLEEELLLKVLQAYGIPYPLQEASSQEKLPIQDEFEEDDADGILAEELNEEHEEELLKPQDDEPKASSSKPSSKNKSYTCLICHRGFRRLGALKQHSSEHSGQETFSCPECMETFQAEDVYKSHVKSHGKSNRQCSVCGKTFKKTFNLTQHVRTHTGEKPFLCSTCGKSFGDSSTLNKHQRSVHNSERPLSCSTCGKTFYHAGHLKVHMRRHTGEKPYPCQVCGKSFAYPDSIKKHSLTHTDHRQFQCNTCGRTFRWRESLKQHTKTHQQQQKQLKVIQSTGASDLQRTQEQNSVPEVPVSVTGTDVVSLTQVIPYLETIRVEYY